MVKVTVIRDRPSKRILKCREGNKIWYQLWLTELDMICIERFFMKMVKLRDGGYLIFKCGMFSFMRKIEVRGEEFLGRIGLRF